MATQIQNFLLGSAQVDAQLPSSPNVDAKDQIEEQDEIDRITEFLVELRSKFKENIEGESVEMPDSLKQKLIDAISKQQRSSS